MSNFKTLLLALVLSIVSTTLSFVVTAPKSVPPPQSTTKLNYYGTVAPYRSGYDYGTRYYDGYGRGGYGGYWNRYDADDMYGDYMSGGYYRNRSPYYSRGYGRGYGYDRYYHPEYDYSGRYPNERPRSYYGYGRYGRYGYGGASIRDIERRLDRAEARAYGYGRGRWGRRSYYDGYGYGGNYRNTYSYADGYNNYGGRYGGRYYNNYDRYGYGGYGYGRGYGGYGYGGYYSPRYYGGYGYGMDRYSNYYNRYGRYY